MKADLHVHSSYSSDSKVDPKSLVKAAKERGIGCVAITDHNSFRAYFDVYKDCEIIVIPAEEVSSKEGHILAYGIDKEIPAGLSIEETIEVIHEAGGIAIAAHPYRWWSGLGERNVINDFDGVESLNARSTFNANKKSSKLAKDFGRITTAGSDAHNIKQIGDGYSEIPDTCRTWQDVIAFLKAEECKEVSSSRSLGQSVIYILKTVSEWMFRGFNRM